MKLGSRIPPELWLQIIELLDGQDLIDLACTCSSMSELMAPQRFSCLRLPSCFARSSQSDEVHLMARFLKRHGNVVTKIRFKISLHPDDETDEEKDVVFSLSPVLQDLLKGNGVPNLETVVLDFRPYREFMVGNWIDYRGGRDRKYGAYIHQFSESVQEVQRAESKFQWRADIQGIFDVISQNTTLKHLEIRNLLPRQCNAWGTKHWKVFLGRLSSLKLGIWGGGGATETRFDWRRYDDLYSNAMVGYQDFVRDLRLGFFKHLTGLRRLHLISDINNALGCEGKYHSPLPISTEDLPCIEDLELEDWFIDPALQNFISARKDRIRRITLTDCKSAYSDRGTSANNPITWATFFHSIRELQPLNLTKFLVTNRFIELDWRDTLTKREQERFGYDDDARAVVKTIYKQLWENENLRLFAYAELVEKHGFMMELTGDVRQSFTNGRDQREYDALMQLVAENGERTSHPDFKYPGTKE